MAFYVSIVFHIFGFLLLVGGIFLGLRAARLPQPPVELLKVIRCAYIVAGGTLVSITGLFQMLFFSFSYYLKQHWFHGKLGAALLLLAAGAYVFKRLQQVENTGQPLSRRTCSILHSVVGTLFLIVTFMTILGRPGLL